MRIIASLAFVVLASPVAGQDRAPKDDPSKVRVEITGCLRGSTFTETQRRIGGQDGLPERKWRVRGPKPLMKQMKDQSDRELQVTGTTRSAASSPTGGRRIGRTSIYIGGDVNRTGRDPLPDVPTIDAESFTTTGEVCEKK